MNSTDNNYEFFSNVIKIKKNREEIKRTYFSKRYRWDAMSRVSYREDASDEEEDGKQYSTHASLCASVRRVSSMPPV